ncbi:retrovirus-related pol polyprotein from transposon TNT 1-94 [Tanacetum coccineum]
MSLIEYADADHTGCQDTRRSTLGSAQFLGDKLVSWSSKKQKSIAISNYGFQFNKIHLYCDNISVIALCCNNVQHSRAKHIDVRYHFIKEQVENGIVELYFVLEPKNYKEALTQACWIGAMQEELHEFERLEVWELVPPPDKAFVISLKWIYKVKLDELGGILKNKARLVTRGYRQEVGIDFEESFAPVARL